MAFRDLWRGRERYGEDRERDRWRGVTEDWRSGQDWRDEGRYGRERGGVFGGSEREYSGAGQRYGQRNWTPESDYSAGRGYGQGGYGRYGDDERDEDRRYGREQERDYSGRGYGGYGGSQDYERGGRSGYGGAGMQGGMYGGATGGAYGYGTGQYRGRGPRGYQRSDERIKEDVCERLTDDPQIDASNMEVTVRNCEVTLSGTVSSREDKRRAEECAEEVSGVKDVHNTLRVSTEQQGAGQTSTQQTIEQTARH